MQRFSVESKIALLEERVPAALELLQDCTVCPRDCRIDRTVRPGSPKSAGKVSHCGVDARLKVSSANLHHGEEPPISGTRGSGTIFLAGCNLKCVYCQNYPISQLRHGEYMTADEVAAAMLRLQERGAHNINFVTPTHCVPQLMEAMLIACKQGLELPIVYNSSGYDKVETLRMLDGIVEIYMPDMRYADGGNSKCYSDAADYPEVNRKAIKEMFRQVGDLQLNGMGVATQGLLVRHLVLPNRISGSKEIFEFLAKEVSSGTYVSLMSQYFPAHKAHTIEELKRRLKGSEYKEALDSFEESGLYNGYIQPYWG
jgi:putative pyruvate formate lyase activating enzyme